LLRKFISVEGKILHRFTGLTKEQRHIATAIKTARVAGLLPFINQ
jgi:ribosomal protein S18